MPQLDISQGYGFFIILAFVFVVANAFFVAAEFAIVKIRHSQLKILVRKGNPVAKVAQEIVGNLDAYLSATQMGVTLASLGLGWIGEPAFAHVLKGLLEFYGGQLSEGTIHSVSLTLAFLLISGIHIVLGELVPKAIALRTAETICLLVALPLRIFYLIFFPFLWVLYTLSRLILKMIGVPLVGGPGRAHTEEELKIIVEDSFQEGEIGLGKRFLLDRALDFSHRRIKEVMVPFGKMVVLHLDWPVHENLEKAKESGHTRFPVVNEKGEIPGFVHMKEIIWHLDLGEVVNLFDLIRPIIFFNEETRLDSALLEFQRKRIHMGLVQKKGGELLGLITLEDVIEQLVGKIEDEFE